MDVRHHYTECGLDYIWLANGFEITETPYGRAVSIFDVDGLHATIGLRIIDRKEAMTGAEVRFLRHELDLSQRLLAELMGTNEQTIARWEKGETKIKGPAQRLLSEIYRESLV